MTENTKHQKKLNSQEAEIISKEFGRFLAERQPIIKDAGLLPYPKIVIMKALFLAQKSIRDRANQFKMFWQSNERKQFKKLFDALGFCREGLATYSDIEPEDKEAVSYFNSFGSIAEVPEDRKKECVNLVVKYMSKGIESDMSSQDDRDRA
jgi:hypothetical protein